MLYGFIDFWEQTMPGAPGDDGHSMPLRQSFFRQSLASDLDQGVLDEGWMACFIEESNTIFDAFYRKGMRKALARLNSCKEACLWRGGDMPAALTEVRDGPLD